MDTELPCPWKRERKIQLNSRRVSVSTRCQEYRDQQKGEGAGGEKVGGKSYAQKLRQGAAVKA